MTQLNNSEAWNPISTFSVQKLLLVCNNAFQIPIWTRRKLITKVGVQMCIDSGTLIHPDEWANDKQRKQYCPISIHSARIAWLVVNGWDKPLELDFGVPSLGCYTYPLQDGHHRLAAAVFRNDETIEGSPSGATSEIEKYLAKPAWWQAKMPSNVSFRPI